MKRVNDMQRKPKNPPSNQTAEKLLLVLEALAQQDRPVKLVELSRELNMNGSTLYRFLTTLEKFGYVMQYEDSEKYALTLKLCQLSEMIKNRFSITNTLHNFLLEASNLFKESAHLAQRENNTIVYIDNVSGASQMLTIRQYIGKMAPMHCTGIGKLLLLEYDMKEIDQMIAEKGLPKYTEHTITTKGGLLNELDTVRKLGYAFDNEECELGVRCIAVPVRDYTGKIVAGISVSGPTTRITDEVVTDNLSYLLDISMRASCALGFNPALAGDICASV